LNLSKEELLAGKLFLLDKPLHWTSFDVVNKLRYQFKKRFGLKKIKVGHAGTLDPLATGLLLIFAGKMTKQINQYMGLPKTYTGTITLGASTPSYDLETEVNQTFKTEHITPALIEKTRLQFIGDQMQEPPKFSAIKKGGVKAYDAARKGEDLKLAPRPVQISNFSITAQQGLELDFEVTCSKGTYIRSLAHDFGQAMQSGAHLSALRRTAIGDFKAAAADTVDTFIENLKA
jgi:tRNA pseudouridine55 synthase